MTRAHVLACVKGFGLGLAAYLLSCVGYGWWVLGRGRRR